MVMLLDRLPGPVLDMDRRFADWVQRDSELLGSRVTIKGESYKRLAMVIRRIQIRDMVVVAASRPPHGAPLSGVLTRDILLVDLDAEKKTGEWRVKFDYSDKSRRLARYEFDWRWWCFSRKPFSINHIHMHNPPDGLYEGAKIKRLEGFEIAVELGEEDGFDESAYFSTAAMSPPKIDGVSDCHSVSVVSCEFY